MKNIRNVERKKDKTGRKVESSASEMNKKIKRYGYCFTCQESRPVKGGGIIELLQTGKKILKGECSNCGSSMAGIMARDVPHDIVQSKKQAREKKEMKRKRQTSRIALLRRNYQSRK